MKAVTVEKAQATYDAMREVAVAAAREDNERRGLAGFGSVAVLAAVRKDGSVSKVWTETSIFSPCAREVFEAALAEAVK